MLSFGGSRRIFVDKGVILMWIMVFFWPNAEIDCLQCMSHNKLIMRVRWKTTVFVFLFVAVVLYPADVI